MTDNGDAELELEQAAVDHQRDVHAGHVARVRALVERLADEAAQQTEDGIRDLVDEDAEVDAAVFAAEVRQTSARAMHAFRRLRELEGMGEALAFGHTTDDNGDRLYIGRLSVIDDDDALLVDWRAEAAMPFYRATPLERHGVRTRRHLLYRDSSDHTDATLDGYSDEIFDLADLGEGTQLRGEAALLASVTAPTEDQMRSVVATIQAEQDAVVRSPKAGALVVQGGPGTGKTVVALHRAAYLLYAQRAELAETGVLIVGPSNEFLGYISGVLPSLGESGVISSTIAKLYPGVLLGRDESPETAEIKGRLVMAQVLERSVLDRQRRPSEDLHVWYGSRRIMLPADQLGALFERARRNKDHNDGADAFRRSVIEALSAQVYDPSFGHLDDARSTFRRSPIVKKFLLRHWPPLTPQQALNDLLGSRALLRSACRASIAAGDLTVGESDQLHRARTAYLELDDARWSEADIPLLDELLQLLGGAMGGQTEEERENERDAADEFELAAAAEERGHLDDDEDVDDGNDDVVIEGVSIEEFGAAGFAVDHPIWTGSADAEPTEHDLVAELGLDQNVVDTFDQRGREPESDAVTPYDPELEEDDVSEELDAVRTADADV